MLEWNVYIGDFNAREIHTYNVFGHYSFLEDCVRNKKKNKDDKEAFAEQLRRDLMYYYWSKCEWEIVLQHWPQHENFNDMKIDVYDQIWINWGRFVDYVWENRKELKSQKS